MISDFKKSLYSQDQELFKSKYIKELKKQIEEL